MRWNPHMHYSHRYNIKYSLDTWLANQTTAKGVVTIVCRVEIRKNGGMLISQPVTSCLTNHSELCMSRLLNNQSRRISIYRLQRRPSFGFESSVSSTSLTSGDRVITVHWGFCRVLVRTIYRQWYWRPSMTVLLFLKWCFHGRNSHVDISNEQHYSLLMILNYLNKAVVPC